MAHARRRFHTLPLLQHPRATIAFIRPPPGGGTDIGTITLTVVVELGISMRVSATTLGRGIWLDADLVRLSGRCAITPIVADRCSGVATRDVAERLGMETPSRAKITFNVCMAVIARLSTSACNIPSDLFIIASGISTRTDDFRGIIAVDGYGRIRRGAGIQRQLRDARHCNNRKFHGARNQ